MRVTSTKRHPSSPPRIRVGRSIDGFAFPGITKEAEVGCGDLMKKAFGKMASDPGW